MKKSPDGRIGCAACGFRRAVRKGTVMAQRKIPLAKWLLAGYLAATGTGPEEDEELSGLMGIPPAIARKTLDMAQAVCRPGGNPAQELARVRQWPPDNGAQRGTKRRSTATGLRNRTAAAGKRNRRQASRRTS